MDFLLGHRFVLDAPSHYGLLVTLIGGNSKFVADCDTAIMHLSICTPTPPPGTTWGNSGAFTSVLTMLWSPGVGYLIREQTYGQTRATCRLYRLCAVFQTPGHRPIASVLL